MYRLSVKMTSSCQMHEILCAVCVVCVVGGVQCRLRIKNYEVSVLIRLSTSNHYYYFILISN